MRHLFVFMSLICCAAPGWCGEEPRVAVERALDALNKAFEKGDVEAMRRLMRPDHTAVTSYYGGPIMRDAQLKANVDLKLTEYMAGTTRITMLTKDVALVAYPLKQKGTFRGAALAPSSYASAVWVRDEQGWREAYYQETPLPVKSESP